MIGVQLTGTATTDNDLRYLKYVPSVDNVWLGNERMTLDHRGEHDVPLAHQLGRGPAGGAEPLLADGRVGVPVGGGEVDHG